MSDKNQNGKKKRNPSSSPRHLPQDNPEYVPLPRISFSSNPKMTALLPKKVRKALSELQPPDHVVEARQECAYEFLERVFLPAILVQTEIDYNWLVKQAFAFKKQFKETHPKDFQDFALIASLETKLELLKLDYNLQANTRQVILRGYSALQKLLKIYGNDLRQI